VLGKHLFSSPFSNVGVLSIIPAFQNFSTSDFLNFSTLAFLIMALKIRLQRHGASHRPFYRMVVTEALARRDGRFVEVLGTYEPQAKRAEDELSLKLDRVDYWKSVGAKPTDTAASLIRKARREAPAEASAKG
jgi:small subunit ribosomal protein S16